MYFRRRLLQLEAPRFRGDPRSNLEVLCHEATFKNVKNHEKLRFRNSVRPDPAAPGPRKLRVVFPVISVLSKAPQLLHGANKKKMGWGGVGLRLLVLLGQYTPVDVHQYL